MVAITENGKGERKGRENEEQRCGGRVKGKRGTGDEERRKNKVKYESPNGRKKEIRIRNLRDTITTE